MHNDNQFAWTGFYMEFADKLLGYKNRRAELLKMLEFAHQQIGLNFPFVEKNNPLTDICPFTVFGAFNKGLTEGNRSALANALATSFRVEASVPTEFPGIPVLNNMKSWFFGGAGDRSENDIDYLWETFESAIKFADNPNHDNRQEFITCYDKIIKQVGVKWNITLGLYWIRPFFYINLDSINRSFLLENEVTYAWGILQISDLKQLPDANTYLRIIEQCKANFMDENNDIHSFPELSSAAWLTAKATENISKEKKGSEASFLQWFEPLIDALKDLGGTAKPEAVRTQIAINLNLADEVLNETRGKTGQKKFNNDVAWARMYLAYEGIIDDSVRGVWALTEKGKSIVMTREVASEIFLKWVDILKERREQARDDGDSRDADEKQYWIYTPGEKSQKWDEFYSQNIMGFGGQKWDELGDLNQYSDREAIRYKMKKMFGELNSYVNSSLAFWQFFHDIKVGDIVFVKKGLGEIIGRGVVESDYIHMPERDDYRHIRQIKWTHNGNWEHPGSAVAKALTKITMYTDYVQKLETLVAGDDDDVDDIDVFVSEGKYPPYSEADFLTDVFMEPEQYETILNLIKNKKNLILQGAPGVGKTYAAKRLAYSIIGEKDTSRVMMIQFHQSYSYEDFIMGFRPTETGFKLEQGPFYTFCKKAQDDIERDYFFIIDEINRGNLSKIFGELLMLIENDKRGEKLRLLYSNELFSVPKNIFLIGLMNTADRSLAMIDYALRRRFAFYEMEPGFDSSVFQDRISSTENEKFSALIECVKELNTVIENDESLGGGFRIGHSYFCTKDEISDYWLDSVIRHEIIPLLKEYWFDEKSKVDDWAEKFKGILK